MHQCLNGAMGRLVSIWDQIGIETDQRRAREAIVLQHLNGLLEDMIGEEDLLRKKLLDNIQKFSQELFGLTEELGLPPFEVGLGFKSCFVGDNSLPFWFLSD